MADTTTSAADLDDSYDFTGLTPHHEWLLIYEGWRIGQRYPDGKTWPQPTPRQVKKLLDRGLLEAVEVQDGRVTVTEYHAPLGVHLAYCMWCGDDGEQA